ncbi:MAG: hypothetical protein WCR04_01185, partial [Fibrobacteraceae bacterium]
MRKYSVLWIALFVLLVGCSESDDGAINIYPDGFNVDGYGYVLDAELDSGYRFHLTGDTLALHLDSMWTFGNCFLKDIELQKVINDSVLTITVKLALGVTGSTDCPQPLFRPDTMLYIPFSDSWKDVREIRIEGNSHNEFYSSDVDTAALASSVFKDSILVRSGYFVSETLSVYLDSSFADHYTFPRRTYLDTAGVLASVDSIDVDSFAYRFMKSSCSKIHDSCRVLLPDTAWPSSWTSDTALVPLRVVCENDTSDEDSLVYCLSTNWKNDSTALSDSVHLHLDTTWYESYFYVEKIPKCASYDHGSLSGRVSVGRYFTTYHTIFVPGSMDSSCGPSGLSNWLIYDLDAKKEVLDS